LKTRQGRDSAHYRIEDGGLAQPLKASPTIYFGGSSSAAETVAAQHADVYLTWAETPPAVAERVVSIRQKAAALGRTVRCGIRLHVITRDSEADAWREAQRLLDNIPEGAIAEARRTLGTMDSVGQSRMQSFHRDRANIQDARSLEIYPNLWAGVGLVRGGAGVSLVGSHDQVAARIAEFESTGVDTFILSAYPNLEEAVRVGEDLLPRVRGDVVVAQPSALVSAS
jgi:alkanesulfonate monooxygenase